MKITISKTITDTVEVELPAFWKDVIGSTDPLIEYVAVLDEKTFIQIWHTKERVFIENAKTEHRQESIAKAYNKYQPCTESEFFAAYEKAIEALRLKPELKDI